jgi:toxin-antitoxin system, toxin component, fic family
MEEVKFLLYLYLEDDVNVGVIVKNDTLWLTQKSMAELFGVGVPAISKHLKKIYESEELEKNTTISKMETVINRGFKGELKEELEYYNLDAIISVGYRVNSIKATRFRMWATKILREYIQKGFVLDDERLKQGETTFGKDYFKELLERVRSIRASERRIWQKITDIFAECSIDYDRNSDITKDFYATIQNKFHYAIVGKTAPEIIYSKADNTKENMGLTNWKNSPDGRILKTDVIVAKNYLELDEIKRLERLVVGYFDYVEDVIERENTFTMEEFATSVNEFLEFRKYEVLKNKGKVSKKQAIEKAEKEYDIFNKTQKIESDFDKQIENLKRGKK